MKKLYLFLAILLFLGAITHAQERRGFYIDVGLGWAWIKYPEPFNGEVKAVANVSGVTRITLDFNLSIGYAVMQNLYLVGTASGIIDSLNASNTLFLTTMLIGPGLKFYPLPEGKYLQIGLDAGYSALSMSLSDSSTSYDGPSGFAFQVTAAGDFDRTLTGPALQLGAKFYWGLLSKESVYSVSLFAKFAYKGRRRA